MSNTSLIAPCANAPKTCISAYQDETYGRNFRVMNRTMKNASGNDYRCTVCGGIKSVGSTDAKPTSKTDKKGDPKKEKVTA